MKKILIAISICCFATLGKVQAQSFEIQQLLLDVSKLAYLKQLLSDMKTGYEVVNKGYTTIKGIASGNFSLHKTFLDGLLAVSPAVQQYKKIADIISFQLSLVSEYKKANSRFIASNSFTPEELAYIAGVYGNLVDKSLADLDDLLRVVTPGEMRMSDEERLAAIDGIYDRMQDKLLFLRYFNNQASMLSFQRTRDLNDTKRLQKLSGQ